MEVGVRVDAEDPITGVMSHCCSAYPFVAVDEHGKTLSVPSLATNGEKTLERRRKEAQMRRDHRLRMRNLRRQDSSQKAD